MAPKVGAYELEQLEDVVKQVAARYQARCWWAEEAELLQQARCSALEAMGTWDPQVGVPLQAYVYRAVCIGLRKMLYPQSYAAHVPERKWGKVGPAGKGVSLEAMTALQDQEGKPLPHPMRDLFAPPTAIERRRWLARVIGALERVLAPALGADAVMVVPVLTGEERPQAVADRFNVKVRKVQKLTGKARGIIRGSRELRKLWEEIP